MSSWRSSSGKARAPGLALAIALVTVTGCRHAPAQPPRSLRLAVFPVQNATGGLGPVRPMTDALEAALAARGLDVVPRRELDAALSTHRIRYTGGVDRATAKMLRDELAADAVVIPTLELYSAEAPPKVSLAVRITSVGERPRVLWATSSSRAGNDAPGILGVGVVNDAAELQQTVVDQAARSVDAWVRKGAPGDACDAGRFGPRRAFRAPLLDDVGRRTVAVLPFANQTARRSAGDVLVNQFVERLARSGAFEVIDPGVVRDELLAHRIILEGGVSVDTAMVLLDLMQADLVLSGDVQVYTGPASAREPPGVEFSAYMLDRETGDLVWSSSSNAEGNDGVFFFGAGRVYTTTALSCRMVSGAVDAIVGQRGELRPAAGDTESRPQALRTRSRVAQFQRHPAQSTQRDPGDKSHRVRARSVNVRRGSTEPSKPGQVNP
jgi:TolB-like protein